MRYVYTLVLTVAPICSAWLARLTPERGQFVGDHRASLSLSFVLASYLLVALLLADLVVALLPYCLFVALISRYSKPLLHLCLQLLLALRCCIKELNCSYEALTQL